MPLTSKESTGDMTPNSSELASTDLANVYRSQANSALGHAETAATGELKELYLRLAECWCSLAQFETLSLGAKG